MNGIDGNPSGDDSGHEVHQLKVPAITRLQEAFVRRVIDTVGDLDNVLWEIGNECHARSVEWQYHMIRFVKHAESKRRATPGGHDRRTDRHTGVDGQSGGLDIAAGNEVADTTRRPTTARKCPCRYRSLRPLVHDPDWVWKNFPRQPVYPDGRLRRFSHRFPDNPIRSGM